ncbi:MAG: hypothetical protein SNI51_01935 [Rikenellaceae bacterium]
MNQRADSKDQRSNLVVWALLMVIFAFTTALLLLSAFIIWFADLIGSLTLSLSITSLVTAIIALSIYKVSLSPALKQLKEEYEMIIAIINAIRGGCHTLLSKLLKLIGV